VNATGRGRCAVGENASGAHMRIFGAVPNSAAQGSKGKQHTRRVPECWLRNLPGWRQCAV